MAFMSDQGQNIPSLYKSFEFERDGLVKAIADSALSPGQIVTAARKALDRTGKHFSNQTSDMKIQRAGLWLLEMTKSGASVLDQGAKADIHWHEVPAQKRPIPWAQNLFFIVGIALVVWSISKDSRPGIYAAIILMLLRFLDPDNWRGRFDRFKFWKRRKTKIEFADGAAKAEARIQVNAHGFVTAISESLKTADHILMRLSEPQAETHWREDKRLMHFVQGLLEAQHSNDGDFALTLIGKELESILAADGIQRLDYNKKTSQYFDVMPSIGQSETKVAAPALMANGQLIVRGTVWSSDDD